MTMISDQILVLWFKWTFCPIPSMFIFSVFIAVLIPVYCCPVSFFSSPLFFIVRCLPQHTTTPTWRAARKTPSIITQYDTLAHTVSLHNSRTQYCTLPHTGRRIFIAVQTWMTLCCEEWQSITRRWWRSRKRLINQPNEDQLSRPWASFSNTLSQRVAQKEQVKIRICIENISHYILEDPRCRSP